MVAEAVCNTCYNTQNTMYFFKSILFAQFSIKTLTTHHWMATMGNPISGHTVFSLVSKSLDNKP